jgi:membrane protein DedA with SNARE-associated domain
MNLSTIGPWHLLVSAFFGTFVSEDLTCVAVGLLVAGGHGSFAAGLTGCFLGIFTSDAALWAVGRLAGPKVRRWIGPDRFSGMERWLDRRLAAAVVAARFLPGTRLPLYLTAGIIGRRGGRFLLWTFIAAALWTPLLVLSVTFLGETAVVPLRRLLGGTPAIVFTSLLAFGLIRVVPRSLNRRERTRLAAWPARLWRWEFWPAWLFYLPLVPYYLWLSMRYFGATVWTAANPGIPRGGVVGESKADILSALPEEYTVPSLLIGPGNVGERLSGFGNEVTRRGWSFPLVLKPDAAQRGAGVKKVHDLVDVEKYLGGQPAAVLAQPYHPGPFEAGVFYYRLPGEEHGRIFSITDKVFPEVVGDGNSTLAELIWVHPRYRMQADVFLKRHAGRASEVLAAGERLPLAMAGNHCQGVMFRDGAHLFTPELVRAVDSIAKRVPGFYIGRFDIRYGDVAEFRAGRGFAIVELNGATAESTNIYDPSWPLWRAYRTLMRQWGLLFRIGAANRRRGNRPVSSRELLQLLREYYAERTVDPLAD